MEFFEYLNLNNILYILYSVDFWRQDTKNDPCSLVLFFWSIQISVAHTMKSRVTNVRGLIVK